MSLVFDIGSSNTVVCENDKVLFDEHTLISISSKGNVVIGNKARGFYSDYYEIFKPIVEGKVVNYDCFETFVKKVVRKLVRFPRLCLKIVVIAIPSNFIVDKNSLKLYSEPFKKMGVKDIRFIPQCVGLLHGV